ncbi:RNA-guided endonuclease InsQ/TnpB family protein [Kineococcus sp. SYSU DK002]|uniref:RNA-guided endonuclease InsQ/TnpB family protein n=1 Tax=Kineococcus sp. SYSU DK002 TaxID=3383123 RepID=UPI003D7CD8E3
MKIVVPVRVFPTAPQQESLAATLRACNDAANTVSRLAWDRRVFRQYDLHHATYTQLKAAGLGAQAAVRVIAKVADAYKLDTRTKRFFKPSAAQAFDDRCLSWQLPPAPQGGREEAVEGTVSIWTVTGRLKGLRFKCSPQQMAALRVHRKGESDLVHRGGMWFLHATCDVPDVTPFTPRGWVGVDLGIANIATTSDGFQFSGRTLNRVRHRHRKLRTKLQRKGTKSAKRLLKRRSKKERLFARDVNHCIAKRIVTEAERTGRGIAVEDLTGIRARVRLRKPQRVTLHSWSFHQLERFLAYKAGRAGVPVVAVDPAYTSQTCSHCAHREKANRKNQAEFVCRSCGVVAHADHNAARNIAARGEADWAAVNRPNAA